MTERPLLELRAVEGGYGQVQVLRGVDVTVEEGKVVVILGANGAGKTTTLRAICGMVKAHGELRFDGQSLVGKPTQAIARMGIAHVPQGRGTFADLTVEDNLRLGATARRDNGIEADLARWYDAFPRLRDRRKQTAGSMSGGEQQMLALARAMMARPRLLLLDEPSLGLAPLVTRELFARLGELNTEEGLTVVVVEQNANLALDIGHWGYVLETGRIAVQGSAAELRENEAVRQAYLGF
ncbi:MAG TPA: ABC transporter ATP-binding protein [Acidimicrobiales bacterium]|nr:ABC transporter ATP-binding protein [Acidimicrobiales bacterium]